MATLAQQAESLEQTLEKAMTLYNQLLKRYENSLFAEQAQENRYWMLEDVGPVTSNGAISFQSRLNQQSIIDIIIVNIDIGTSAQLQIGRYTRPVKNSQTQETILAPVRYEIGPADQIRLSWNTALTDMPYFALFGHYVGSQYG